MKNIDPNDPAAVNKSTEALGRLGAVISSNTSIAPDALGDTLGILDAILG